MSEQSRHRRLELRLESREREAREHRPSAYFSSSHYPPHQAPSSASHCSPLWCSPSHIVIGTKDVPRQPRAKVGFLVQRDCTAAAINSQTPNPSAPHETIVGEHRPQLEQGPDRQPRPPHHIDHSKQTPNHQTTKPTNRSSGQLTKERVALAPALASPALTALLASSQPSTRRVRRNCLPTLDVRKSTIPQALGSARRVSTASSHLGE